MTIYEEYSKTKQAIKALSEKLKDIEPKILEEIKDLSEPMRTNEGAFTTVERVSYKYSDSLKDKKVGYDAEIRDLQAKEVESGKAESSKSVGIRFTPIK